MGLLSSNDAIGKTAKEIADIIGRSKRTVEHHLEKIKLKTGSSSKSELIEKIIDERFV
jgi:DNA-binding CsgD family transcriptional regulator